MELPTVVRIFHTVPPYDHATHVRVRLSEMHHTHDNEIDPNDLDTLLVMTDVVVRVSDSLDMRRLVGRHGDHRVLLLSQEGSERRVRLQSFNLRSTRFRPHRNARSDTIYVATCCSALPHTRAVAGVKAFGHALEIEINDLTAAWLGYAIFHPEALRYNTSCFSFTIGWRPSHRSAVRSLASMAKGDNLLVAMGVTAISCSAYLQAKLRAVCVAETRLPDSSADTFLCVVLPGHGIGWALTNDILEIRERPPGECCVRRLRFCVPELSTVASSGREIATRDWIVDVLAVLGSRLEFLDLVTRHTRVSPATLVHLELTPPATHQQLLTETLHCVLTQCPRLKRLRVRHDGTVWSADSGMALPELPGRQVSLTTATIAGGRGWITEPTNPRHADCSSRLKTFHQR